MQLLDTVSLLEHKARQFHLKNKRIALIPTSGDLHPGDLALITEAKKQADILIVTLFHAAQSNQQTTAFTHAPCPLQIDLEKLAPLGINILFVQQPQQLYPNGYDEQLVIKIPHWNHHQSDTFQIHHEATLLCKLLNIVQPAILCLSENNRLQLRLAHKIIADLNYTTTIFSTPITREKDGLACSAINQHLATEQRSIAPILHQAMDHLRERLLRGERRLDELLNQAKEQLYQAGFLPDTLQIYDHDTLGEITVSSQHALILFSAWLGHIRLTDSCVISLMD